MAGIDDQFTKTLIHANGNDAATSLTDESGRSWTFSGSAQLDTSLKKFGTSSLQVIKATSDYIYATNVTDFQVGAGDFTIDFWFAAGSYPSSGASYYLAGHGDPSTIPAMACGLTQSSTNFYFKATLADASNTYTAVAATVAQNMDWNHYAFVKNGDKIGCAYNGAFGSWEALSGSFTLPAITTRFSIGRCGVYNAAYTGGRIDEFRFSRCARWTADFTPWTVEYYKKFRPIVIVS